jgi:hypothetical protein
MKILLIVPAGKDYRIMSTKQRVPGRSMLRFRVLPVLSVAAATPPIHKICIRDENVKHIDFNVDLVWCFHYERNSKSRQRDRPDVSRTWESGGGRGI